MKKKIIKLLISFCLVVSCLFLSVPQTTNIIYADTQKYSNVLDDLQKDENFNAYSYAINKEKYTLEVITIAESEDKELFVYVYQPCYDVPQLHATSINISTSNNAISYNNYELYLLNGSSCFFKYKVKNFIVSTDTTRTYEISSIYRNFVEDIDTPPENESQTINEVNFKVGKKWTFQTTDGVSSITDCKDIDLIQITDKFVGFARYITSSGTSLNGNVDRHFVAFSTDRQIDKLLSADVYYKTQSYSYSLNQIIGIGSPYESFGDIESHIANLNSDESFVVGQEGGFLWWRSYQYEWAQIQTAYNFFNDIDEDRVLYKNALFYLKDETTVSASDKQELLSCDWVLTFAETDYNVVEQATLGGVEYSKVVEKTIVSDVSILRLEFKTDGVIYNLGVLDNKQTGPETSIVSHKSSWHLTDLGWLIAIILLLLLLGPILPFIIRFIVWLVKVIFNIIALPFRLISEARQKKKDKKKGKKK